MFAVVTLELNKKHLILPINWVNQVNFAVHAERGVISDETHIVFYSKNETASADFRLPITHVFEQNSDACYTARINKFFVNKDAAIKYCQSQRAILPKTYSEYKIKQAHRHNAKLVLNQNLTNHVDETDAEKQHIANDIRAKLAAMNQLHIDLTTEEIDQYQQILEGENEDNDSFDDDSDYEMLSIEPTTPVENDFSVKSNSLSQIQGCGDINESQIEDTDPNKSNENVNENNDSSNAVQRSIFRRDSTNIRPNDASSMKSSKEVVSSFSKMVRLIPSSDSLCDSGHTRNNSRSSTLHADTVHSFDEVDEASQNKNQFMSLHDTNRITNYVNALDNKTKAGEEDISTVPLSTRQSSRNHGENISQLSSQLESLSSNSSTSEDINFMPNIAVYPMDSKIHFETASTDELPFFSPPSKRGKNVSDHEPFPNFFRKLEPEMYTQISEQLVASSAQFQPCEYSRCDKDVVAGISQSYEKTTKEDESVADSIVKHTLNTNHLHFPGKCSFENGRFRFSDYNVELKYGVVDLIRGFQSMDRNTIFYDAKFVAIMLTAVIGNDNLIENKVEKSKLKFIKDTFMMRVGSDAQRLMRYSGYIEKRKDQLRKRANQKNK